MRLAIALCACLLPSAALASRLIPPAGAPAGGDLVWTDLTGKSYRRAEIAHSRATAFIFASTRCPCSGGYAGRLAELSRECGSRGARLFMVLSNRAERAAEVRAYVSARGLPFPAVRDAAGALATRLGARSTPTAVVVDAGGTVRYRGRIDDDPQGLAVQHHELRDALFDLLDGRPVRVQETKAAGCALALAAGPGVAPPEPKLVSGLGSVEMHATAASDTARMFVDQGLMYWYGFNFDEAERSFREAARLDPRCAMAHWGIALALGMNYNWDYDPDREGEARAAIRTAERLAAGASPREKALVGALGLRHPDTRPSTGDATRDRQALLERYHARMAQVYATYPHDPDVATLYAASAMDLRPWDLWTREGEPRPGTPEILRVLEETLRQHPDHVGANHFEIHATEQSAHPERGLDSARRLGDLAPNSGHLIHMPSHIFLRVGDYERAAASNRRASNVDEAYINREQITGGYTGYYLHTLDFRVAALCMEGRSKDAVEAAGELAARTALHDPTRMPRVCGGPSSLLGVWVRFGRWDDILAASEPAESAAMPRVVWHYARGLALVARRDLPGAEREMAALVATIPAAERSLPKPPNPAFTEALRLSFQISRRLLGARLAMAKQDTGHALAEFREGVSLEDRMPYLEAPGWRHPVREAMGNALLALGRPAEAEQAFRQDLHHNPNSGRSLFGLARSLEAQGKRKEAESARNEARKAWSHADVPPDSGAL